MSDNIAAIQKRMKRRQEKTGTSADIHEQDVAYLERCLTTARRAAEFYGWKTIPFEKDGQERAIDEKNAEIYRIILDIMK